MKYYAALVIAHLALLAIPSALYVDNFSGQVVGVLDGDTIDVLHNGKAERIRLKGIDCPEKGQAFGKKAKQFWARIIAAEIWKQGIARRKEIAQDNGEAIPPPTERFLHDTLTIPDLAAGQALDRSRLLLQHGTDIAAMALDAAKLYSGG